MRAAGTASSPAARTTRRKCGGSASPAATARRAIPRFRSSQGRSRRSTRRRGQNPPRRRSSRRSWPTRSRNSAAPATRSTPRTVRSRRPARRRRSRARSRRRSTRRRRPYPAHSPRSTRRRRPTCSRAPPGKARASAHTPRRTTSRRRRIFRRRRICRSRRRRPARRRSCRHRRTWGNAYGTTDRHHRHARLSNLAARRVDRDEETRHVLPGHAWPVCRVLHRRRVPRRRAGTPRRAAARDHRAPGGELMLRRRPVPTWFLLALLAVWALVCHALDLHALEASPVSLAFFGWIIAIGEAIWSAFQAASTVTISVLAASVNAVWAVLTAIRNGLSAFGGELLTGFRKSWGFLRGLYDDILKPA